VKIFIISEVIEKYWRENESILPSPNRVKKLFLPFVIEYTEVIINY